MFATTHIDGFDVKVNLTSHADFRMDDRNVSRFDIMNLIIQAGEELLDMRRGEEFAIVNTLSETGVVCVMNATTSGDIRIDIKTVLRSHSVFVSRNTRTLYVGDNYSYGQQLHAYS